MEKEGENGENTIEKEINSGEDTKSDKEDENTIAEMVDPVEGSTDPSNSYTFGFQDQDVNESDMEEEEKVLEFFRRNSGLITEVAERNNFPYFNKSEGMVLQFQEDTPLETEQGNTVFHSLNSPEIPEGIKSSSASNEDTGDSSSDSDLDFSLSRYYFDGSLPVSPHVEEHESHQDESPVPKDENQMPLLCPKQPVLQTTSWRNCCGLLGLLRAADS